MYWCGDGCTQWTPWRIRRNWCAWKCSMIGFGCDSSGSIGSGPWGQKLMKITSKVDGPLTSISRQCAWLKEAQIGNHLISCLSTHKLVAKVGLCAQRMLSKNIPGMLHYLNNLVLVRSPTLTAAINPQSPTYNRYIQSFIPQTFIDYLWYHTYETEHCKCRNLSILFAFPEASKVVGTQ